jgi:serine phosphatase RsbU (regulator of sigma subunit)
MTLNEVCPLLQVKGGMVLLVPEGGGGLKVISSCGSPYIFKPDALISGNIVGRVLQTTTAELSNNRDAGELFENGEGIIISLLCAPLKTEKGAIGAIVMLGDGSRQFTAGDLKLLNAIAMQTAPAIEIARLHQFELAKAQLEHDLQMAYQVQSGLLPSQMPVVEGWRLAAFWRPARGVSGDFYDFIHFPDGRLGLVIADVSDKGVPAALVMANTRSLLRAVAANATKRKHLSPGEILARANNLLCKDMPMNMFVTCQMVVLDPKNGQVCVANAGHNLPLRSGANGVFELRPTGLPLGLFSDMVYDEVEITLSYGDSLLMYSDGLVEAHNPRGDMFGTERLRQFLAPRPGFAPLQGEELIQYLLARLAEFTGPEWEQEDDVTFVTLERLSKP